MSKAWMEMAIHRAVTWYDAQGILKDRATPFSCRKCEKEFSVDEFVSLPALDGYLLCEHCFGIQKYTLQKRPFSGGYLVRVLDTKAIDGYAFSHSASVTLRAVAYNQAVGYFLVKQLLNGMGADYQVMRLPADGSVKNKAWVTEYEQTHAYDEEKYREIFHPFLMFIQTYDVGRRIETPHLWGE